MAYDLEKYGDFYEKDAAVGAANRLAETQYGLRDGQIYAPSVYYTNYVKQLGLVARWADKAGANLLDIGCGDGELREKLKRIKKYVGLDVSPSRIAYCREKFKDGRNSFLVGEILNFDFSGEQFAVIVASEIIEHVPDDDLFMVKIKKLLVPGGRLILSTPLADRHLDLADKIYEEQHLRLYDTRSVKELLLKHGFKIVKIRSVGFRLKIKLNKFNKKILSLFKESGFGKEEFFEFSLQYNNFFNKLYFKLGRWRWLWLALFNLLNFFSKIFPRRGNQVIILAKLKE